MLNKILLSTFLFATFSAHAFFPENHGVYSLDAFGVSASGDSIANCSLQLIHKTLALAQYKTIDLKLNKTVDINKDTIFEFIDSSGHSFDGKMKMEFATNNKNELVCRIAPIDCQNSYQQSFILIYKNSTEIARSFSLVEPDASKYCLAGIYNFFSPPSKGVFFNQK